LRLPPFAALRAFEAVSRCGSIRRAAEELGVDHAAVSRQVRQLQDWLGTPLARTSPKGVFLTPAGADYAAVLSKAFSDMAQATARLGRNRAADTLTLWCLPGFALRWLTPRLADFTRAWPEIEIIVRPGDRRPDLLGLEADCEIHYGEITDPGVRQAVLATPRVFPVASPFWLAQRPEFAEVAALPRAPLIHEESDAQWRLWFGRAGVAFVDGVGSSGLKGPRLWHAHLAIEAAKLGQGVALANDLLVSRELAAGELIEIGATKVALQPYVLAARAERWSEPALTRFRRWLMAQMKSDGAAGR